MERLPHARPPLTPPAMPHATPDPAADPASAPSAGAIPGAIADTLPGTLPGAWLAAPRDAAEFERLYRATAAHVHTLARRLVGAADADDATQEVYVRAWHKRDSFRGEGDARGWLHRLARNALLNRLRDRDRERGGDGEAPSRSAGQPRSGAPAAASAGHGAADVPAPFADLDARLDLAVALEALPRGAREIFVLHDVERLRHEEIAALLDVSVGTSKSQLHRARLLLRRALGGPPEASTDVQP